MIHGLTPSFHFLQRCLRSSRERLQMSSLDLLLRVWFAFCMMLVSTHFVTRSSSTESIPPGESLFPRIVLKHSKSWSISSISPPRHQYSKAKPPALRAKRISDSFDSSTDSRPTKLSNAFAQLIFKCSLTIGQLVESRFSASHHPTPSLVKANKGS